MKILLVGDMHLRTKDPQRRTDSDFMQTCLGKLEQVCRIAADQDCGLILQAGDFFDRPDPSKKLLAKVIRLLLTNTNNSMYSIHAIHGQHDLAYHTQASMESSALRVLEAAGTIVVSDSEAAHVISGSANRQEIQIHGASFGETPRPLVKESDSERTDQCFDILIAHTMVGDKPLWPGQDLPKPKAYAKKHPGYDLYLLGDYHYPFEVWYGDKAIINPGCLIRKTMSEKDHEPKVVVFDTETRRAEDVYLEVAPAEECFNLDGLEASRPADSFSGLTDRLKKMGGIGVSFAENLQRYFEENKTLDRVRQIVWAEMEKNVT